MDSVNVTPLISEVSKQGALEAFMLLTIIALLFMVKHLVTRNENLSDKVMEVVVNNTAAFEKFTEVLRATNNQKS